MGVVSNKFQTTSGVGSSPTANKVIRVLKPYYKKASDEDKQTILACVRRLKEEPGVPIPINLEQLLNK